jgi:hypothetical protein
VIERMTFWARVRDWLLPPASGPACVAEVNSRAEADVMAGFLRTHGIAAHVSADDAGGTDPVYQLAFGVRVIVPRAQEPEARRLLSDAESSA